MLAHWRAAIVSLALLTAITGIAYPVIVTAVAQLVFPHQASGIVRSLLERARSSHMAPGTLRESRVADEASSSCQEGSYPCKKSVKIGGRKATGGCPE